MRMTKTPRALGTRQRSRKATSGSSVYEMRIERRTGTKTACANHRSPTPAVTARMVKDVLRTSMAIRSDDVDPDDVDDPDDGAASDGGSRRARAVLSRPAIFTRVCVPE